MRLYWCLSVYRWDAHACALRCYYLIRCCCYAVAIFSRFIILIFADACRHDYYYFSLLLLPRVAFCLWCCFMFTLLLMMFADVSMLLTFAFCSYYFILLLMLLRCCWCFIFAPCCFDIAAAMALLIYFAFAIVYYATLFRCYSYVLIDACFLIWRHAWWFHCHVSPLFWCRSLYAAIRSLPAFSCYYLLLLCCCYAILRLDVCHDITPYFDVAIFDMLCRYAERYSFYAARWFWWYYTLRRLRRYDPYARFHFRYALYCYCYVATWWCRCLCHYTLLMPIIFCLPLLICCCWLCRVWFFRALYTMLLPYLRLFYLTIVYYILPDAYAS